MLLLLILLLLLIRRASLIIIESLRLLLLYPTRRPHVSIVVDCCQIFLGSMRKNLRHIIFILLLLLVKFVVKVVFCLVICVVLIIGLLRLCADGVLPTNQLLKFSKLILDKALVFGLHNLAIMIRNPKLYPYQLVEVVVDSSRYLVDLLSMHVEAIIQLLHTRFILFAKLPHFILSTVRQRCILWMVILTLKHLLLWLWLLLLSMHNLIYLRLLLLVYLLVGRLLYIFTTWSTIVTIDSITLNLSILWLTTILILLLLSSSIIHTTPEIWSNLGRTTLSLPTRLLLIIIFLHSISMLEVGVHLLWRTQPVHIVLMLLVVLHFNTI